MEDLFLKIIEMSIMGSVVILITVLARFLLRKRSKRFIMILWAVVAIRLLLPFSIESQISIFNYLPVNTQSLTATADNNETVLPDQIVITDAVSNEAQAGIDHVSVSSDTETEIQAGITASAKELPDITTVLAFVWLTGTAVITACCSVQYIDLKRRLKDAKKIGKNIYESEKVKAPFVFGFIVPKIYLPDILDNTEREYILRHERTHIKHGDWISKIIGMAIVAVHWFNPLVWLAYILFERDIEMRCDESVVADMDIDVKQAYTISLVTYARKSNNRRYLVTPLGFSKNSFSKAEVTNRVKNIINYKEGRKITAVLISAALLFVGAACSLNSSKNREDPADITDESVIVTESHAVVGDSKYFVKECVGTPYEAGGTWTTGFDAPGFVVYYYREYFGIELPYDIESMAKSGIEVSADEIQVGDIVFFDNEGNDGVVDDCAVYIGDDTLVHASADEGSVVEMSFSSAENIVLIRRVVT